MSRKRHETSLKCSRMTEKHSEMIAEAPALISHLDQAPWIFCHWNMAGFPKLAFAVPDRTLNCSHRQLNDDLAVWGSVDRTRRGNLARCPQRISIAVNLCRFECQGSRNLSPCSCTSESQKWLSCLNRKHTRQYSCQQARNSIERELDEKNLCE